jgi:hypothetical protein
MLIIVDSRLEWKFQLMHFPEGWPASGHRSHETAKDSYQQEVTVTI